MRALGYPSGLFYFLLFSGVVRGHVAVGVDFESDLAVHGPQRQPPKFKIPANFHGAKSFNPHDKRFLQYRRPGPDDVRSPCPAINAAANHGFLPRSGKHIGIVEIIIGLFLALGVSPELSAIIFAFALIAAKKPITVKIDLDDLHHHHRPIEHDCSFSRDDVANTGNNNDFNATIWAVTLKELRDTKTRTPKSGNIDDKYVNVLKMGRAKARRVEHAKSLNPKSEYGAKAWFNSLAEVGLITSALGIVPGIVKLSYLRSIFEEERLPYHIGWIPRPFMTNLATALGIGVIAGFGDYHAGRSILKILVSEPTELLSVFVPPKIDHLDSVTDLIGKLGFDTKRAKKAADTVKRLHKKRSNKLRKRAEMAKMRKSKSEKRTKRSSDSKDN